MDEVDKERLQNPPRTHTRASAMANQFVNTKQKWDPQYASASSTSIFKMRKFLAVKPRTDSVNHTYKPIKRGQSEMGRNKNKL